MADFELLRDRALFVALDDDAFAKVKEVFKYTTFQPGDVIIKQGHMNNTLMIIEEGEVEIVFLPEGDDQKEKKLATLRGSDSLIDAYLGGIIGEMSIVDIEPASATVRAVTEVNVWMLDRGGLHGIFFSDKELHVTMITNIARLLSRRLRDLNKKLLNS